MSEQNPTTIEQGNKTPPPVVAETDWFLQNLVNYANQGIEMSITLQVSGMLVSGTLISGAKYFDEFAAQFAAALRDNAELSESFRQLISSYKKIYEINPDKTDDLPPPQYVHLQNARFCQPGQTPIPQNQGVLWRGRTAEIGGFNLGSFSAN